MTAPSPFLDREDDELELYLMQVARRDAAPLEARQRALATATAAALGASLVVSSAQPTLLKTTGWLAAKWLAVGAGSGLAVMAAAHGVELAATPATETPSALVSATPLPRAQRHSAPSPDPVITSEPVVAAPPPVASFAALPSARASVAPSAAPAPPLTSPSNLSIELGLLERARAALTQRNSALALRELDSYQQDFPGGNLQVEAAALRVEAVAQSGNRELARRLGESFLKHYPTSPLASRVRAVSSAP